MVATRPGLLEFSCAQRAELVRSFDQRYGEMERVLWCLSKNSRAPLIDGRSSSVVEALVWTVKSWWGIQGVRSEARALIAQALADSEWSAALFEEPPRVADDAEEFAFDRVTSLVAQSMALGLPRREFSLASKVLHWLLPWRIPVYDGFVRQSLGLPVLPDHPEDAYRVITRKLLAAAREDAAEDCEWLGGLEPRAPLRGFDKCLWLSGGGSAGTAAEVKDPWRIVSRLGLDRSADIMTSNRRVRSRLARSHSPGSQLT
jgi:hypothetical protein